MSRVPLDLVACPDRRLTRAAVELVARDLADGETEVSVLLPDRKFKGFWHRILHDRTAEAIERDVSKLPHANVTTVPFHFGQEHQGLAGLSQKSSPPNGGRPTPAAAKHAEAPKSEPVESGDGAPATATAAADTDAAAPEAAKPARSSAEGITPIADVRWRQRVTIEGQVQTLRVKPSAGSSTVECIVEDGTGAMSIVFIGRKTIGGLEVGTRIRAQGTAAEHRGRLAILNPAYALLVPRSE
jgi:hypothetical protein